MKYVISKDGAKELIINAINRLQEVSVKGDSVEHLFAARLILNELLASLQEIKLEDEKLLFPLKKEGEEKK